MYVVMLCCLYHVFTYIYSLLIKKYICDCRNVSIKLLCVCVCLLPRDVVIFSIGVSSFFSYFLCYLYFHVVCFVLHLNINSNTNFLHTLLNYLLETHVHILASASALSMLDDSTALHTTFQREFLNRNHMPFLLVAF